MPKVIVDCEYSAEVRDAFARRGWDAWSCDLLPSERGGKHYQCDCRSLDYSDVDLVIAHPPCTRLSNSGVRWLFEREGYWVDMIEDALFFKWFVGLDVPCKGLENPIQHKYARAIIGREYDQIIQPWQFGHGETKATCLWLFNLPKLIPTNIVQGREGRVWRMPPSPERAKERARTYPGIAEAMAEQWGSLL